MRINHLSPQFTSLPNWLQVQISILLLSSFSCSTISLLLPCTHEVLQTLHLSTHTSFFPLSHCKVCPPTHSTSSIPASSLPALSSLVNALHPEFISFSFLSHLLDLQFCFTPSQNKNKANKQTKKTLSMLLYFRWILVFQSWQLFSIFDSALQLSFSFPLPPPFTFPSIHFSPCTAFYQLIWNENCKFFFKVPSLLRFLFFCRTYRTCNLQYSC